MSNKLRNTRKTVRRSGGVKQTLLNYISNNKREYMLVVLLFVIGIVIGVIFINKSTKMQEEEITTYINEFVVKVKANQQIDRIALLREKVISNLVLVLIMWFVGSTVVGIPIVYAILVYKGFCLGYTISAIIAIMGMGKGILFMLIALLLQNIIFIPGIIAIGVSGFKLYKSIVKDRNKDNIKVEVLRHTIFSSIMLLVLCIASVIEILISTNMLKNFIKYF